MSFDLDNIDKPVDIAAGEWVGDIPNHPGMKLKVRSKNYKRFDAAHNKLLRSFGKRAAQAIEGPEYKKAVGELLADHILLGWENALTKGGKDVAYEKKTAKTILTSIDDRGIGESFGDAVAWAAAVVADRHLGLVDDLAGN